MKVLLDSCIAAVVFQKLDAAGYDVEWTGNWRKDPGDETILAYAYQNERVLFTLDKDFGTLAALQGKPHVGIVRLVGFPSREQPIVTQQILEQYNEALAARAILTVDHKQVRIRLPNDD